MGILLRQTKKSIWSGEPPDEQRRPGALEAFRRHAEDTDGVSVFEIANARERELVIAAIACSRTSDDPIDFLEVSRDMLEQYGPISENGWSDSRLSREPAPFPKSRSGNSPSTTRRSHSASVPETSYALSTISIAFAPRAAVVVMDARDYQLVCGSALRGVTYRTRVFGISNSLHHLVR